MVANRTRWGPLKPDLTDGLGHGFSFRGRSPRRLVLRNKHVFFLLLTVLGVLTIAGYVSGTRTRDLSAQGKYHAILHSLPKLLWLHGAIHGGFRQLCRSLGDLADRAAMADRAAAVPGFSCPLKFENSSQPFLIMADVGVVLRA